MAKDPNKELRLDQKPGRSKERMLADVGFDPAVHGMSTVLNFSKGAFGELPMTESMEAMLDSVAAVRKGDLSGPEAMLVAQATALNAIFTELARRAAANMGEYIKATESYMRLALKAQAQSRSTIEALAALKNPPVVFARQANIANGSQQVNNHSVAPTSRAENSEAVPNELLESDHGKRLDGGAAGASLGGDKELETVGAVDRATHGGRQVSG